MATPDDIRSGLIDAATSIDVGDLDSARADVHGVVRRRRVRSRVGAALGAIALVVAGAIAVTAGSDEPDTLVSADPTVVEEPADSVPTAESTPPAEAASTAQTVVVLDRAGVSGAGAGDNGALEAAEWATPWRDGFLVGRYVYTSPPLPEQLPDEVRALFPQEVLDLFVDGLPSTIDEATAMLSEAGLLDVVSTIISEHPEASAAIYGDPVAMAPTVEARFTTDGVTWEPVEVTLPPGASYLSSVTGVDDHLVVAYDGQFTSEPGGDPSGDDNAKIATTTDLTNWTIQEISPPAPPIELPDGIERSVHAQGLVANDSGWVVTVYESIEPDVMKLLSAEERARFEGESASGNGYGMSFDDTGVSIDYYGADGSTAESIRYEWIELGIEPDVVAYLSGNEFAPQVWAATWAGEPARSDGPADSNVLLATTDGFLQWTDQTWFSPDGLTWTASPLPVPDGTVNGAFAYDGGVIVMSVDADGVVQLHRVDEMGGSPEPIDVPGLPDAFQPGFGGQWAPGSAVVLDAAVSAQSAPLEVELDGYRLSIGGPSGAFTLTDVASNLLVASEPGRSVGSTDSAFSFDLDGITVTDPTTGDVLVVIPNDVMRQAEQEAYGDLEEVEYEPDLWLLATGDGERFVVNDLDDVEGSSGPAIVVANDDSVLVNVGDNWTRYDLA